MEIQKPAADVWSPSPEIRQTVTSQIGCLFQAKPHEMFDVVVAMLTGNLKVRPRKGLTSKEPIDFHPNYIFSPEALKDLLLVKPYNFDAALFELSDPVPTFNEACLMIQGGIFSALDSSFGVIAPDTCTEVFRAIVDDDSARLAFDQALKDHLHRASVQLTALEKARPLAPTAEAGFATQKPSAEWFLEETRGHHGLEFSDMMVKYTIVPMFEHNPFRAMFVLARVDRLCKTFDLKAADHANAWAYICENIPCPEVRMTPIYSILASSVAAEPWEVIEHLVYTALTRYAKMLMSIQGCPVLSVTTLAALLSYVRTEERRRIIVELF